MRKGQVFFFFPEVNVFRELLDFEVPECLIILSLAEVYAFGGSA
jgi:hypothetical protein